MTCPFDASWSVLKQRRKLGAGKAARAPRRELGAARWTDPNQTTQSQLMARHKAKAQTMHEQYPEPPEGFLNWLKPSWWKQRAEHKAARKRTAEQENREQSEWLNNSIAMDAASLGMTADEYNAKFDAWMDGGGYGDPWEEGGF